MGLHHRHLVGRALHGEEAREELAIHKRDSHGHNIVMNIPENFKLNDTTANDVQTAVSVVYVTLSQTFDGPASLSTMTGDAQTPTTAALTQTTPALETDSASSLSTDLSPAESSYLAAQSAATAVNTASATLSLSSSVAAATSSVAMATATAVGARPVGANSSPSAVSGAIQSSSNGMSGGAKAGLAIGLILAIALALGLAFFCWRRRKNPNGHEEILDEKHASFADAGARSYEARHANNRSSVMSEKVASSLRSLGSASTAPRLSLRPVTQFLPTLANTSSKESSEKPKSAWERHPVGAQQNPFDDAARMHTRSPSLQNNPFDESQTPDASKKHTPQSSWEGSEPPTPKSTKFGTASAVSVAAAGAPNAVAPPRGPNNVHRVQLDFKPSMEDELELRSGQLVRMLHEYDDGWALCIRMDRSQQGVAPRTCLSKLPVKPRPQGPAPNSRPGTAGSQGPRPNGPSGAPYSRPHTPQQAPRVQTPEPGSVPSRKPVPGQAM